MTLTSDQEATIVSEEVTANGVREYWAHIVDLAINDLHQGIITLDQYHYIIQSYDDNLSYFGFYHNQLTGQVSGQIPYQPLPFNPPFTLEIPCFCRGTLILTPGGEVPVEQLKAGDRVTTLSGAARPVTWVGSGRSLITPANEQSRPIIVRRDALGDGVPSRDLYVTGGHALYLDGVLIPAEFLVNHRSIRWDDRAQEVSVYHIELDTHDILLANGAPAESYRDDGNRWLF
ncbi:MAG TPA: Hint domain-containing protein, partial [Stellaceae bacterium]|nr:Hint domain-containing protein [Stellaceae bacterium]